ncbi:MULTISPECIES: spore coat protein [Clostridium]|uniref:spore coat protein n=1 Tax=Clostridium TaxID=1485 RepID=UPI0008258521|nr:MULTISPECIES: spore coat protein [Clostridium]PJI07741.1 spore coat protein [Clostridium sp. CT7]
MNTVLENAHKMDILNDHVIASDFLIASKSAIRNYAIAITESVTPEVRTTLKRHLDEAISLHERILNYMMTNGYYQPYNTQEQYKVDMKSTDTALNLNR